MSSQPSPLLAAVSLALTFRPCLPLSRQIHTFVISTRVPSIGILTINVRAQQPAFKVELPHLCLEALGLAHWCQAISQIYLEEKSQYKSVLSSGKLTGPLYGLLILMREQVYWFYSSLCLAKYPHVDCRSIHQRFVCRYLLRTGACISE